MKKLHCVPGLVCLLLFLLIGISSYTYALEVPVFSPLRYSITDVQGTAVYTDTVTMGNVISGEFHLIVQNGSNGANKVDLAEVYINGKRLVKMKSTKDLIDKKFKLLQDSELRISLTGSRDSFVVVSIIAKKVTQVPLVIRMAQGDAQAAMTNALLRVKKKPTYASHGFVPTGSVISQTPPPGVCVKEKTKASITVSTGPDLFYALLPGTPETPASSAVVDYSSHDTITDTEIDEPSPGVRIARTKLEIGFTSTTTVGQINELLTSIGAQITAMLKGVNQVIIRIPDPGNMAALDTLIAQIQGSPIVRYVIKDYMPSPSVLPPNVDVVTDPGLLVAIDHHLDVRAHAAWNMRDLLNQNFRPPYLIVADYFGDGRPNTDFAVASSSADFATGKLNSHGYHVLGIIAATFGGSDDERGWATGMYPGYLPLWPLDLQMGYGWNELFMIPMFAEILGGRIIFSTSLGIDGCSGGILDKSCVEPMALSWIEKVRGSALYATGLTGPESLENTFLHLTSAGNVLAMGDTDALLNSPFTAARLLPTLTIPGSLNPVLNLTNTLAIENRKKSATPLEGLGCISDTSKKPGDLSAIGEDVWSLTGATVGAGYKSGTSMATPQVAGLAAYLWALEPSLSPQDIMDILGKTADPTDCGGTNPRSVIDAYGAVLALDRGYANARIRRALLDVADRNGNPGSDRHFNDKDIEAFLGRFDAANGKKDYSRYDLNGDGKTGGATKARFNLDMDYPFTYGTVSQDIDKARVEFKENELTDLDILCYYAYSRLYTGSHANRKDLLRDKCAELTIDLTFPSTIEAGANADLQIRAGYLMPDGSTQWTEGINITVTVSGGSAASGSGTTDANGYFSTTVQHDGVSIRLVVTVTATDSGGREVIKTVEASTGDPVNVTYLWTQALAGEDTGYWQDDCNQSFSLGGSDTPLTLPTGLSASCDPYSQLTVTVQETVPGQVSMLFAGSAKRVNVPWACEPPSPNCYYAVHSYAGGLTSGRILAAGTYTVEMFLSPSFDAPLAEQRASLDFFVSFVGGGSREISCDLIERSYDPVRQCQDGTTIFPLPANPFTVDIDVPRDGINDWSFRISTSSSPYWSTTPPADISLTSQVFSIKPK